MIAGQVASLARDCARAFQDDPLGKWLVPDESQRLARQSRYFRRILTYALRYGETWTTPDATAAASWAPPGKRPFSFWRLVRSGLIWAPFDFGPGGLSRLSAVDGLSDELRSRYAPKPHWYLMLLFTEPERQRQGLASAVLQPVFDRADRMGAACYLETMTEYDVHFYEKRGFKVAWEGEVPRGGPRMWTMVRGR
jgi:GNAT superfamily N-acetyltransferase